MKTRLLASFLAVLATTGIAASDPALKVQPKTARPGDAVLVTVTGTKELPKGTAAGAALHFYRAKTGYQALFAVPLEPKDSSINIEVDSVKKPAKVAIDGKPFAEASVIVEEEMANPPPAERTQIDADNKAMLAALTKLDGDPLFTKGFKRPVGATTSPFGEWRTFNDGHRSQHLGFDVFAKEATKVLAINAGTVTLVRDTFLAGKVVVVGHGRGIASAYFHLSSTDVAEGDAVPAGAVLGLSGHTGRTTGPHLHLSVRVPGGFVDPAGFFKLPISAAAPAPEPAKKK